MAQWDDGYVTDVTYTTSFYREITPCWLAMTSLLLGHRPPDVSRPFAYADLGCGNGFTTLVVAATCPQAEVWGFDFNPAHIEFATRLAAAAGISNVQFRETSFAALAANPAIPDFDIIASHGVLSWISAENRRQLVACIARRLRPGGLVYLSYNVTTGWSAMVPVRALMRMLTVASPERSDLAVPGVMDFVDRLRHAGAAFFQAHPTLENRLQDMRRQDPRYVAHEYLNQDWHPMMFAEVAGEMAEAKCRYIGSATLTENIEAVSVPPGVAPMLGETRDPVLRETLRDLGCAQAFRRDLYRKGLAPMGTAEQQSLLEALTLLGTGVTLPEGGMTFTTPIGTVTGLPEVYQPLVAMIDAGPVSLRDAKASPAFANRAMVELVQAVTLLMSGNHAHPMLPDGGSPAARDACRRLNQAIARYNASGTDLTQLVAPAIGSSIGADVLETLLVGELLAGRTAEVDPLTTEILAVLARGGRSVQRDGAPVADPVEARRIVTDAVGNVLEKRQPLLRRLGILD